MKNVLSDPNTIIALIALLFGFYIYIRNDHLASLSDNNGSIETYLTDLNEQKSFSRVYRNYLQKLLSFLYNIFDKPYEKRTNLAKFLNNLSFHILLSLFYTLAIFIFIWLLDGTGKIGFIDLLPSDKDLFEKLKILGTIGLFGLIFYYLTKFLLKDNLVEIIDEKAIRITQKILQKLTFKQSDFVLRLILIIIMNIVFLQIDLKSPLYLLATFFILSSTTAGIIFFTGIIFWKVGLTEDVEGVVFGVVVGAGGILGVGEILRLGRMVEIIGIGIIILILGGASTYLFNETLYTPISISVFVFIIILPIINAILDYFSLSISRFFAKRILKDSALKILFHIILDILVAISSFVLLFIFLYLSIEYMNTVVDNEKLNVPILEMMLNALIEDPLNYKEYGWISFMLFSTLIPTLLHVIIAIFGLIVFIYPKTEIKNHLLNYKENPSRIHLVYPARHLAIIDLLKLTILLSLIVYVVTSIYVG